MTAAAQEYGGALYALAVEHRCEDALLESLSAEMCIRDSAHTEGQGESVNSFINRAINETIARDKEK